MYRDTTGGAPDLASLVLLGSETVTLAAGLDSQKQSATFSPALEVPAGSTIFVEYAWEANPDTATFPGGNLDGQTAQTFILSDDGKGGACGIVEYTPMSDIGFPDQATIVNVHGTTEEPSGCVGDLDDNGVVNGLDLALLLGDWGPCPGCDTDLDGNGVVNGLDLALLLGAWGPC